jgi:polyhydroxyalkanoate depolymerase
MTNKIEQCHHYPEVGVPFFWPFGIAMGIEEKALELEQKNMAFLDEVVKTEVKKEKPEWATKNKILKTLHTFTLRDFSVEKISDETPVFILPPYAGHTSIIADFHKNQSLVETLLENRIKRVVLTDWHSATQKMKDYDIDNYLEELHVAIDDLGGRVHLVGLCQGGWMAGLYAARFPKHVASLVLAGSPIDTHAGNGVIKEEANRLPMRFFENLVAAGNGLLQGRYMLQGFKNMHPEKQYIEKYEDLYEHIGDPDYIKRTENFERWYEYTINLPGKWYLQVIRELFKGNYFIKKKFVSLSKTLDPKDIKCPLYLLAGDKDDITPKEQVFAAEQYFGTPENLIVKDLAEGGHIGLFMGSHPLTNNWSKIADWLLKQDAHAS